MCCSLRLSLRPPRTPGCTARCAQVFRVAAGGARSASASDPEFEALGKVRGAAWPVCGGAGRRKGRGRVVLVGVGVAHRLG